LIIELEIPIDHLHMIVRGVPKMSPSDVMQIIKSFSAREFFRRYPDIGGCADIEIFLIFNFICVFFRHT